MGNREGSSPSPDIIFFCHFVYAPCPRQEPLRLRDTQQARFPLSLCAAGANADLCGTAEFLHAFGDQGVTGASGVRVI